MLERKKERNVRKKDMVERKKERNVRKKENAINK